MIELLKRLDRWVADPYQPFFIGLFRYTVGYLIPIVLVVNGLLWLVEWRMRG